jgi:hypothetical protein
MLIGSYRSFPCVGPIKAEWLRWLCTDPQASAKIPSTGIYITGTWVKGELDLRWTKIAFPLRASYCKFTDNIVLDRSTIRSLQLDYTEFKNLSGRGMTVEYDLLLRTVLVGGPLDLERAAVAGFLDIENIEFKDAAGGLNLNYAKIGRFYVEDFHGQGDIYLGNAQVTGDLDINGAEVDELDLHNTKASSISIGVHAKGPGDRVFKLLDTGPRRNRQQPRGTNDMWPRIAALPSLHQSRFCGLAT